MILKRFNGGNIASSFSKKHLGPVLDGQLNASIGNFFDKIANNLSPTHLTAYLSNNTSPSLCSNRISYQITFRTILYRTEHFKKHFIYIGLETN